MLIVETERTNLTSMKNVEHLNYSINEHMKRIKESLDGKKILQLFQVMAEHSVKYAGMSYMNNKTMASKLGVDVRTIQRYTKKLEQLHVFLKIPTRRKKNKGQTSNTYVILPVLKRACHGGCHPLNPSLNPLKQESNIINSNPSENKIIQYIHNRVHDSIKQGTKIEYLSSYIDRIFRSLERKAIYAENMRVMKLQEQREEESRRLAEELGITKKLDAPFYNWLETKNTSNSKELDELGIY